MSVISTKLEELAKVPHPVRDWWLAVERVASDVGKRLERPVVTCPECGGPALVDRGERWRCTSFDKRNGVTVAVCDARGVLLGSDTLVTRGSNGLWKELLLRE